MSRPSPKVPLPVIRALRKLGQDIRDARRRRRIPVAILSERASIGRMTLNRIEKGDPGTSLGQEGLQNRLSGSLMEAILGLSMR